MHSVPKTLGQIVSSTHCFLIPPFQRPYSWKTDRVFQFVSDIWQAFQENSEKKYWVGPVILRELNVAKRENHCDLWTEANDHRCTEVIDGQQRLTTLYLIYLAIVDFGAETWPEDWKRSRPDRIQLQTKNNDALRFLLDEKKFKSVNDLKKRDELTEVYRYLRFLLWIGPNAFLEEIEIEEKFTLARKDSVIEQWEKRSQDKQKPLPLRAQFDFAELSSFAAFVKGLVELSAFMIEPTHDEVQIFSVLNGNREELTQFDLIRNFVFASSPEGDRGHRDDVFVSVWEPGEELFRKRSMGPGKSESALQNDFVYDYLISVGEGAEKGFNKSRASSFFRSYMLSTRSKETDAFTWASERFFAEAELWWIQKFDYWKERLSDDSPFELSHSARRSLKRIQHASQGPSQPLIQWCLRNYTLGANDELTIQKVELEEIIRAVECYVYSQLLAGRSNTNLRAQIMKDMRSWGKTMATDDDLTSGQKILNYVRSLHEVDKKTLLNRLVEAQGDPSDGAYKVLDNRGVIGLFDAYLDAGGWELSLITREDKYLDSKFEVEHIAPQLILEKPSDNRVASWKDLAGSGGGSWRKTQLQIHSIGNLTVVPKKLNETLGVKPFAEKKRIVKNSKPAMTYEDLQKWTESPVWNDLEIKSRTEIMMSAILEYWKHPEEVKKKK